MFIPLHDRNALKHIRKQYVTLGLILANVVTHALATLAPHPDRRGEFEGSRDVGVEPVRVWKMEPGPDDTLVATEIEPPRERTDAEGPEARAVIARLKKRFADAIKPTDIEALARKFAAQTSTWQRVQLAAQTKAALGIDVVASDTRLPALIDAWIESNVGLIKNLGDRLAADVEAATLRAVESGKLWPDLAVELEQRMGFTAERARLIGRDQIGKAYASIEQARQRELGVRRYVWHIADDERVRGNPAGLYPRAKTSHFALDGRVFSYDDPPLNDDGEPISPGFEINCRCFGEPVWDDILNGDDEVTDG